MNRRFSLLLAVALSLSPTPMLLAQEPVDRPRDGRWAGMAERLAGELQLDEQQRTQYDEIVARYREQLTRDSGGAMRETFEQMRAAREAGDQEQLRELGQQMRERRRAMGDAFNRFYDEIQPILRPEQQQLLADFRQRAADRERRANPMRALQDLRETLNLDQTQQQQFDELLRGSRERVMARREGGQMRELVQQMREAREAGDDEKAEQLRAQLVNRDELTDEVETFLDELMPILRDDQKALVEQFRTQFESSSARGNVADFRTLIAAARRVDLRPEQTQALRQVYDDARRAAREARDGEGRATLAAKVRDDIRAVLDAEQFAQFEQNVARATEQRGERRIQRGAGGRRSERQAEQPQQP